MRVTTIQDLNFFANLVKLHEVYGNMKVTTIQDSQIFS